MASSDQCISCKHYLMAVECRAFPAGIPIEIFTGEYDHTKPFAGDGGIMFEPFNPDESEGVKDVD